jgi:hypothetical protein
MASYNFFKDIIGEKIVGTDGCMNKWIINVCRNYVDEFQTSSQPFHN